MSRLSRKLWILLLGFIPALLFLSFLTGKFYPVRLTNQIPLFFDLIELHQGIPLWLGYILVFADYLLIWLIAKRILIGKEVFIPLFVFSLSPWLFYLTWAGSFYAYLLSLMMLAFLGLIIIAQRRTVLGMTAFISGSVFALYSSLLILMIFPLLIIMLVLTKLITLDKIKFASLLILLFCLPLFFALFKNQAGLKNIFHNQVTILSDPSLISATNQFQGESRKKGFSIAAKLVENKYIFIAKFALLKSMKHITPSTYFTSQEGLLTFSFTPPIFAGFLVPFLYGLYLIIESPANRKFLFVSLPLLLPSILSQKIVDLNKLILFEPIVIFIISYGIIKMLRGRRFYRLLLLLSIVLLVGQFLVTIFDITYREYPRYERYFGEKMEIEQQ